MKALVVYYSRKDSMHAVAHAVAVKLDADLDAVVDHLEPDGVLGWHRVPLGHGGRIARADQHAHDLARYDVVVVGTPVHDTAIASTIADFLADESSKARALAFLCTTAGAHGRRGLSSMARAAQRLPIVGLAVTHADVAGGGLADVARRFASDVRAAVGQIGRGSPPMRVPLPGGALAAMAARRRSISSG